MIDRIKKHIEERDSIIEELKTIMVYCNDSQITLDFLDKKWAIMDDELHLQVGDCDLDEDYYGYEISSMGAKGEQFFMGGPEHQAELNNIHSPQSVKPNTPYLPDDGSVLRC